jgi:hypothetical protein
MIGCFATARAAEKIRYEEIPARLVQLGGLTHGRNFKVTTIDGTSHVGASFRLEPDQVVLYQKDGSIENIPVDRVVRVSIRRERAPFFEFTKLSAVAVVYLPYWVCDGDLVCAALAATVISPVVIAVAAGSAPVTLALDCAAFFIPSKVYEIVH